MERPILAVDVDGVLNPWGMPRSQRMQAGFYDTRTPQWGGAPLTFNPRHGPMLLDFAERTGFELMWATAWQEGANKWVSPLLGLPELPVLHCYPDMHGPNWKFEPILPQVAGRPMAWLDDQFFESSVDDVSDWFLDRRPDVPTLLVPIEDYTGLTIEHLNTVESWWSDVSASRAA